MHPLSTCPRLLHPLQPCACCCSGPLRGKGVWKMPTGLVQQGEDVTEAAEREVGGRAR